MEIHRSSVTKYVVNGKEYRSLNEVPSEFRHLFEDKNGNGIPDAIEQMMKEVEKSRIENGFEAGFSTTEVITTDAKALSAGDIHQDVQQSTHLQNFPPLQREVKSPKPWMMEIDLRLFLVGTILLVGFGILLGIVLQGYLQNR